jgi:large subunit ribosomal protein L32
MAVAKSRKSRSRRDMRRSANSVITPTTLAKDPTSGETHRRHHVTKTGMYRGKQMIAMAEASSEE